MDQQTVTYLLIAALLATALLIALAVVIPRMPRRGGGSMAAATAGGPMLLDSDMATSRAAMSLGSPASANPGRANGSTGAADDAEASSDALTGLLSASRWGRIVADEDARVRRYRRPATIVMIELDGLERLVERLGRRGRSSGSCPPWPTRSGASPARPTTSLALEPGRFAVLLPETDEVQAINYVERVRRACDLWLESGAVALRLAIGWASASGDDSLLDAGRLATERMYAEIRRGRPSRRRPGRRRAARPSARRTARRSGEA